MGAGEKQGRSEGGADTAEAPVQRSTAPGRQTLTMGLGGSGPGPAMALLGHDGGAAGGGDGGGRGVNQSELLDDALRPDLAVQRKAGATAQDAAPSGGSGQPLAPDVRAGMEHAFGADFSAVRVHEGEQAPAIGALAYTQGADIHFAPGQYAPGTDAGRSLLGHELAHVVQQAEGRVSATAQAKGVAINDDDALEREADDKGARAARGERVGDGNRTVVAGASGGGVQRYAFINGKQVTKAAGLSADKEAFVTDKLVRDYKDDAEFTRHAAKSTDYLGNLASDGTWMRFSPTGINLLGESHIAVTLQQVTPVVGTTNFIREAFSNDDLSASPHLKSAYEAENANQFKIMGIDGVADKKQHGAESLFPKIGYGMTIALPYFNGSEPISGMESGPGKYDGKPIQKYLKMAWAMAEDAEVDVAAKRKAKTPVEPKYAKMADTRTALMGTLDGFITPLAAEGFLGDELKKPGKAALLPDLAKFAVAVSDAMIERAADDPSSRLDAKKRAELKKKGASEAEKDTIFSEWRDFNFEDSVKDATARGVRYAGMGRAHLDHLKSVGLTGDQHAFDMIGAEIAGFRSHTADLESKAVPGFADPAKMTTAELIKAYNATADVGQKAELETEMRTRWVKVTVNVVKAQENPDDVYVKASHGGREYKTGEMKMKAGAKNTFWISLDKLVPVTGKILIEVYDYDLLSSDDLISIIGFNDPYTPQSDNRPWDGAEYHTTVEFDR